MHFNLNHDVTLFKCPMKTEYNRKESWHRALKANFFYVLAVKDELILFWFLRSLTSQLLLTIPKQIRMKCCTNYQVPIRIQNNEMDDVLYPQKVGKLRLAKTIMTW